MALPIQTILIRQLAGYLGEPLFLALLSTRSHLRPGITAPAAPAAVHGHCQGRRVSPSRNKQEPAQRSISPAS
jgi:hypothetical protein